MKLTKVRRIQNSLEILKQTLVEENLQIGVNSKDNSIFFFDTDTFLETGRYDGVVVEIRDLVN